MSGNRSQRSGAVCTLAAALALAFLAEPLPIAMRVEKGDSLMAAEPSDDVAQQFLGADPPWSAYISTLVCNDADAEMTVAVAIHNGNWLFSGNSFDVAGWHSIAPGACKSVSDYRVGNGMGDKWSFVRGQHLLFSWAGIERTGWRITEFRWDDSYHWGQPPRRGDFMARHWMELEESKRSFCTGDTAFNYTFTDGQSCDGSRSERFHVFLTTNFPSDFLSDARTGKFTVRVARARHTTTPPSAPGPPAPAAPSAMKPAAPAAAAAPKPRPVPKPLQAGTVNATFLDTPLVRWEGEKQWYWYRRYQFNKDAPPLPLQNDEDGSAVPSPPLHHFDEAPYDRHAGSTDSKWPSVAAAQLALRAKDVLLLGRESLMVVRRKVQGGETTQRAKYDALDVDKTYFLEDTPGWRFLFGSGPRDHSAAWIPCRSDKGSCVFSFGDDWASTDSVMKFDTAEPNIQAVIATLQQVRALYEPSSYVITKDAGCSCVRIEAARKTVE